MRRLIGKSFLLISFLLFVVLILNLAPNFLKTSYVSETIANAIANVPIEPPVKHLDTPESVKAIYMTACVAADKSWRESLKKLVNETELNSVIIDIKDYTGVISLPTDKFPRANTGKGCIVSDMKDFIKSLHDSDIYVIGRVSVFQDPSYTKLFPEHAVKSRASGGVWKDHKGLSFVDVGATPYWDYVVELSKVSYEFGFDEINYDYIRYPSDGNMQDTSYTWTPNQSSTSSDGTGQAVLMTKAETLESFFKYLDEEMSDIDAVLSADLFGMTTTVNSDMNIGQVLERALPYFDYIAPMVYPSHYPKSWNGFANPAEKPYEVIKISMGSAVDREEKWRISQGMSTSTPSKMRPWIQDFNLGATYGPDKVRAQIQATYDVGLNSWMLWDAANTYTKEALLAN